MLAQAGLAIAYNAKKGLDRFANVALAKSSMTDILHLLGSRRRTSRRAGVQKPYLNALMSTPRRGPADRTTPFHPQEAARGPCFSPVESLLKGR